MENNEVKSSFGALAPIVQKLSSARLIEMYFDKCGMDVSPYFFGLSEINQHECSATGMRFWLPESLAGDEKFYRELSRKWQNYYRSDRWEYEIARSALGPGRQSLLEIGCGRGYFLQSLESMVDDAIGLELNNSAVENKVTSFEIRNQRLEDIAASMPACFDAVCSFQVLEHVTDPAGFIGDCVKAVRPGGLIILSTPNYAHPDHFQGKDPFDMPPHHLNHFTEDTFKRIASGMNLELVFTKAEIIEFPRAEVYLSDSHPWPERLLRKTLNAALRTVLGVETQLGHTLIAVLRRPENGH